MGRRGRAPASAGALAAAVLVVAGLPAPTATAGATFEGRNGRIAWSRDGDIFTMRRDGTGTRRLTDNPRYEVAEWSPDGERLAVLQWPAAAGQRSRILVVAEDGRSRTVVARARFSVQSMAWSPDGRRIAFCDLDISRPDEPAPYPSAIKVVDLDAGTQVRLTDFADRACGPSWSPDGDRIAYTAGDAVDTDVHVIDADGGQARAVLVDPAPQLGVDWSPTGETLATVTLVPGSRPGQEHTRLETVLTDGTRRSTLADSPAGSADHLPVWSPDGERVLFSRVTADPYAVQVGVAGPTGNGAQLVTDAQDVGNAAWSPTSGRIVVARDGDLFRLRADGSGLTRLTGGRAYDASPDWQAR